MRSPGTLKENSPKYDPVGDFLGEKNGVVPQLILSRDLREASQHIKHHGRTGAGA